MTTEPSTVPARLGEIRDDLADLYRDLHAHPELSYAERRTAAEVARRAGAAGYEVATGVGRTGVVAVLRNGEGPTVLLRADMDALPVEEKTGLPYASTATGTAADGTETPVMHACGHDMHTVCLLGALDVLAAAADSWSGTVLAVFQPAEELATGAAAMVDDGLFERFGTPDVTLGQHVAPLPAGWVGCHAGPAFAATDSLRVRMFGRGGHGSRPETTVDPVVMAASTVMRLQTVVSREVAAGDAAVVTVGSLRAGTKENIIPDEAELQINVRSFDTRVRERVLEAITRIVKAEAAASGAEREPEITPFNAFPCSTTTRPRWPGPRPRCARSSATPRWSTPGRSAAARTSAASAPPRPPPPATGCSAAPTPRPSAPPSRPAPSTATSPPTTPRTSPRSSNPL
ncbi:amidohydrolase [Nocardiopsis composta]